VGPEPLILPLAVLGALLAIASLLCALIPGSKIRRNVAAVLCAAIFLFVGFISYGAANVKSELIVALMLLGLLVAIGLPASAFGILIFSIARPYIKKIRRQK
jgi:hypothetical protein